MKRLLLTMALLALAWPAYGGPGQAPFREGRRGLDRTFIPPPPPPVVLTSPAGVTYAVFVHSQSQARDDAPLLSTVQNNSHQRIQSTTLSALTEPFPGGTFESLDTAVLHQLTSVVPAETDWWMWKRYASDQTCAQIARSTALYNQQITQVSNAASVAAGVPTTLQIPALVLRIGNTDEINGTDPSTFLGCLRQIRRDFEADLAPYLPPGGLTMFIEAPASWTTTRATTPLVDAMLAATDAEPTRIILVGPEYWYPYADTYHMNGSGHRWDGQQIGKAMGAHFFDLAPRGLSWRPMRATRVVADGTIARVYVDVPCLRYAAPRCGANPLARDTTLVSARTNDGWTYVDTGIGVPPTISSIASAATCAECGYGEWRLDITMSDNVRSGSSYAYAVTHNGDGAVGFACEPGATYAPGCNAAGNWRDSDTTAAQAGANNLGNWLMHGTIPVSGGVAPTGLSQIANAQGIELSDNTEYLEVADNAVFDFTTQMTVLMWIRPTATIVASAHLATKWVNASSQSWIFRFDGVDADDLIFYASTTSNFVRCTACDLPINATTFIAAVYDGSLANGSRVRIYTGAAGGAVSLPTQAVSGTIPTTLVNSTGPLLFGYISANHVGLVDEPAVYNVALTQAQLSAINGAYTSGVLKPDLMNAGSIPDPVGWWPSEGDSGTTVTDGTGAARNGTLQSGAALVAAPGVP